MVGWNNNSNPFFWKFISWHTFFYCFVFVRVSFFSFAKFGVSKFNQLSLVANEKKSDFNYIDKVKQRTKTKKLSSKNASLEITQKALLRSLSSLNLTTWQVPAFDKKKLKSVHPIKSYEVTENNNKKYSRMDNLLRFLRSVKQKIFLPINWVELTNSNILF